MTPSGRLRAGRPFHFTSPSSDSGPMTEQNPSTQAAHKPAPKPATVFAPWADTAARPLVEFIDVRKEFGGFTAVDGVSLKIYFREFFALLGPSGCGKTTLLRMLAGFETPTSGQILVDGKDISAIPANQRPINMMFQSYALFPHLSVADNIAFGLKRAGMARPTSKSVRRKCWRSCRCNTSRDASRTSFPAASASASRLPARSPASRRSCCSTNRSARSTPSCASRRSSS